MDTTVRDWEETQVVDPITLDCQDIATIPYDDRQVVASIEEALHDALDRSENGLRVPAGYNLLGGIAQFQLNLAASKNWNFQSEWHSALHFVKGEAYINYQTMEHWRALALSA
ncbi:hypothetical protein LTR78_005731 [Recurvomyces mirabilis]|uniref:Uncharacterized protein n=1 Tax=Recurvomyces mirabilis TaxID=574656 RepID=A0AAE1C0Z3_9PEZI|nr:hypothetical protein LTR78_005731 [Recurvomyces mirabilis]KAK5154111.1 hypothetical protein LTS14_006796 [Recurvomyces mirabilis]